MANYNRSCFLCLLTLASAFVEGGRIVPDEKKLVRLKPAVHLSFTYDVLSGLLYNYLTFITRLFIYCHTSLIDNNAPLVFFFNYLFIFKNNSYFPFLKNIFLRQI